MLADSRFLLPLGVSGMSRDSVGMAGRSSAA